MLTWVTQSTAIDRKRRRAAPAANPIKVETTVEVALEMIAQLDSPSTATLIHTMASPKDA